MGSTRDDSVIDTYIVFGKTSKNILEFRDRRYEECTANVVVTHTEPAPPTARCISKMKIKSSVRETGRNFLWLRKAF